MLVPAYGKGNVTAYFDQAGMILLTYHGWENGQWKLALPIQRQPALSRAGFPGASAAADTARKSRACAFHGEIEHTTARDNLAVELGIQPLHSKVEIARRLRDITDQRALPPRIVERDAPAVIHVYQEFENHGSYGYSSGAG